MSQLWEQNCENKFLADIQSSQNWGPWEYWEYSKSLTQPDVDYFKLHYGLVWKFWLYTSRFLLTCILTFKIYTTYMYIYPDNVHNVLKPYVF